MKTKIYCISGLGVDERAFENIRIPGTEMIPVQWVSPDPKEDLTAYAFRLFQTVNPINNSVFIGVSFGGMIAQEWAQIQEPKALILISTTHHFKNVKSGLRTPGKLGLNRFLHPKIAVWFAPISFFLFGVTSEYDKEVLKNILRNTDPIFFRWATGVLLKWSIEKNANAIQIHGKKDRMITPPDTGHFFTNGGHFTIYTEGEEISAFLAKTLHKL